MQQLQAHVNSHLDYLRKNIDANESLNINNMNQPKKKVKTKSEISSTPLPTVTSSSSFNTHFNDILTYDLPAPLYIRIWPTIHQQQQVNQHSNNVESFYRFRRQNNVDVSNNDINDEEDSGKKEKQEDGEENFDEFPEADPIGGNGLVSLIASLSGGEGGSDVGALVGALSGVITNLFGVRT
jgi:hypothetical protein